MSDEEKPPVPRPPPPIPCIADRSQDAAVIVALNERNRRAQRAANMSSKVNPPRVLAPPPPVFANGGSQDAALIAAWEAHRRRAFIAATTGSTGAVPGPEGEFPVIISQTVITPYGKTNEGQLIRATTLPLLNIIRMISKDPSRMYEIDPRKWEEIVVASYEASGLFDEVVLTPRSGDWGKDLIAVKRGFVSLRIVESVKRYTPGHVVTGEEVNALIGVMAKQPQTSKGIISTTWEFAPRIMDDPDIARLVPYRLELVNGTNLVKRLAEFAKLKP